MSGWYVFGAFISFVIAGAISKEGASTTKVLVCISCGFLIISIGLAQ